jgi:hypothetical protein
MWAVLRPDRGLPLSNSTANLIRIILQFFTDWIWMRRKKIDHVFPATLSTVTEAIIFAMEQAQLCQCDDFNLARELKVTVRGDLTYNCDYS